jgi:hypothetical protein
MSEKLIGPLDVLAFLFAAIMMLAPLAGVMRAG